MDTDKKAKTASPPPGTLIYLGPTFRQPVLLMYGPKHFGELFADPDVKACFLPLDKAGEALRGMREKQGFFTTHERVKRNHIKG